ncbi:MAG: DUF362 domain-containing protein [Firmicutes bacterium]|nr:DUF362 domain-containing protein [Bacillota bacterium]
MEKSKVYFSREISSKSLVKLFEKVGKELKGNIAIKVHSGEDGNQNYLRPAFLEEIVNHLKGTIVECNTAYPGMRDTTEKHKVLLEKHGWSKYFKVDILDAKDDLVLNIPNGKIISKNYVGKNIENYDSMLVLSHFKGHPMGGYGGALKQLSIGLSSSKGKRYIHCAGKDNGTYEEMFDTNQLSFLEAMADAASSVINYFENNIVYLNVMCNMSVDCDCCANAQDPCMKDIGILASTDPVAIDKACIDLVFSSNDPGKDALIKRIEDRKGTHVIDAAYKLGIGNVEYELVDVD